MDKSRWQAAQIRKERRDERMIGRILAGILFRFFGQFAGLQPRVSRGARAQGFTRAGQVSPGRDAKQRRGQ